MPERESASCKACGIENLNGTGIFITISIMILASLILVVTGLLIKNDTSPVTTISIMGFMMLGLLGMIILLIVRKKKGRQ